MKSLMIVQHGDFQDDYTRLADGGSENYRDQRRAVEFVSSLAPGLAVTNLPICGRSYDVELAPNLHALGVRREQLTLPFVQKIYDRFRPEGILLRTPHLDLLEEANRRGIQVLPCFADIFTRRHSLLSRDGLKTWRFQRRLRKALMDDNVAFIANHSLNASRSMTSVLGIPPSRIVPWDWSRLPMSGPPKEALRDPAHPRLFFAGTLNEDKGVGDCLDAIRLLKDQGRRLTMTFCGRGDVAPWIERARALDIVEEARILGMIPNEQVRDEMRDHDVVVVPSRHSFAEGLPNTIYEGLASRSALVISDHPAFAGRLRPDEQCLVFTAADPASLAGAIARLLDDPTLYGRLSAHAEEALNGLYVGMDWAELVNRFIADPRNGDHWVERNALVQYLA